MDILNIFYNDFLIEAKEGFIDCELIVRLIFNSLIVEDNLFLKANTNKYPKAIVPTLVIKNKELFNDELIKYVNNAIVFYTDKRLGYVKNPIKYIIASAFANMTASDFLNPSEYFNRLTSFLQNNLLEEFYNRKSIGFSKTYNSFIDVTVNKEPINEEAPYSIQFYLTQEFNETKNFEYSFQKIRFGIVNDEVYIYAIQHEQIKNDDNNNNNEFDIENKKYKKGINRISYKTNEGINPENELYNANPGAINVLTLFIGLLANYGITRINVPVFLIERWNDKEIKFANIEERYKGKLLDKTNQDKYDAAKEENLFHGIQMHNIVKKLMNTVYRFNFHFPHTILNNELAKSRRLLTMETVDTQNGNNQLLYELYNIASNYNVDRKEIIK